MHTSTLARRVGAIAVVGALLSPGLMLPAVADPVSVQTMVSDKTSPAVHAVFTQYDAKASLKQTMLNDAAWRLLYRGVAKAQAGELTLSTRAVAEWAFDHIEAEPEKYLTTVGKKRTVELTQSYVGTAFFVNGSGNAITARHVVTPDADISRGFAADAAKQLAKSDGDLMIRLLRKWDLSSKTKRDIRASVAAFDRAKVKLTVSAPKVSMMLGVAGAGGSRVGQVVPVEVVHRSSRELGVDVAVLQVRTLSTNMPAVTLATEAPGQGSQIYVNCFTADATWNADMSTAAQLLPTGAAATITAVKPSTGGINLLQTDAPVGPGCSGGAAFDADGDVVGIVVSGVASGQTYVQPVGLISEALQRSGVDLKASLTSERWNQALTDYYQGYFSKALAEVNEVRALYAPHAYVDKFIADSQIAITEGRDQTPEPEPPVSSTMIAMVIGSVVLGAGGALVFVLIRRRRTGLAGHLGRLQEAPRPGPSSTSGWPAGGLPEGYDVSQSTDPWIDRQDQSGGSAPEAFGTPLSSGSDGQGAEPSENGDDAPDTFPSWRPIDFEPVYPSVDSEPGTGR